MGVFDEFFDVNPGVAEGFFSLASGGMEAFDEGDIVVGGAHAAAAAASDGFDHHRVADPLGNRQRILFVLYHPVRSRRRGNSRFSRQRAADGFIFQGIHRPRIRADEPDVAAFANIGEMGVLSQETVTGMDSVYISNLGGADDAVDSQVTFASGSAANANRFVRQLNVHRIRVGLGIDGHCANVQLFAGSDNPYSDLASVCYQHFLEHVGFWRGKVRSLCHEYPDEESVQPGRILNKGCPNSTGLAFSTMTWVMTPLASALISFITFMASMMHTTVSGFTSVPTST